MYQLTPFQSAYIRKLASRYVRFRKSGSIDVDDLMSAASIRWWQFGVRNPELRDEHVLLLCFYQQVKGAMRDVIRASAPVNVTRTIQAQLQAYQVPYTVDLDHAVDVLAGDHPVDVDQWLDVVAGLKKLAQREQIILSLYFEKDLTFTEIAEVLDVSVSTVTRAYQRAVEKLKKILK